MTQMQARTQQWLTSINRAGVLALAILTGTIGAAAVSGLQAQETARGAYDTPIWKTIILGTYRNANDMREALELGALSRRES